MNRRIANFVEIILPSFLTYNFEYITVTSYNTRFITVHFITILLQSYYIIANFVIRKTLLENFINFDLNSLEFSS